MENEKQILLTKEGEKQLRAELNNLINNVRPEVIEELKEARAQGDLSENADYDAARNRQAEIESRILEIESLLNHVKIIKKTNSNNINSSKKIKLGSEVIYVKMDHKLKLLDKKNTIKIVGAIEADPFKGLISNESPLAKAIMNKTINDIVEVKTTKSIYKLKIKEIN